MLEVSTATRIITPKEPCLMGGYSMRTQKSTGVLDDLKCTALVLKVDGEPVVMCDIEVLMIFDPFVRPIKERLQRDFGVKPEFATIATIHTHAAPEMRASRLPEFENEGPNPFWKRYTDFLSEQVYQTVKDCFDAGFAPVTAEYRTINVQGFYGNRNGIDKPEDKDATVIKFVAADGATKAGMVNMSCHPTVLGAQNLLVSGDLLGYVSREYQKQFGVYPVMVQGAAGDMSNRHYRQGHDAEELKRTGDGVAAQLFASDDYMPLNITAPRCDKYHYETEYDINTAAFEELRGETEAKMAAETEYDKHKVLQSMLTAIQLKLKAPHIKVDFWCSVLRLGDLEICKVPGEMFSRFGKKIKQASRARLPLIWGYSDDYAGYMSNKEEYGQTYESLMGKLPRGATEELTEALCAVISGQANH